MTTIRIDLPEALARKAKEAGLLEPKVIESLILEELVRRRSARELIELAERISAKGEPLKEDDVQAFVQEEIDRYRAERRTGRAGCR